MDESTVHKYVKQFFRSKGYGVPEIRINLAGMWPDVVAHNEAVVIAVEAKDDPSRAPEALGQAIVYQLGSNRAYVAVPKGVSEKHRQILRHLGLGLLEVEDNGDVKESIPAKHACISC